MTAASEVRDEPVQLCAFRIGDEEYVIDIMRVEEILAVPVITKVRRAPSFVEGVVNLRGAIIPVVDVRRQLLGEIPKAQHSERLVLCKLGTSRVALRVDAVNSILKVPIEALRAAPMAARQGARAHILGVCTVGTRLLLMLDVKALLVERGAET
jgi:purine-binding chemotaxis protein CheW